MLEDRFAQHDKIVVDKYVDLTANYQMTTYDYVVRASVNSTTNSITITLPSVAEAKGRFYSILARSVADSKTITIAHKGDSEGWTNIVLSVTGDHCFLYSDGSFWHIQTNVVVVDTTAAGAGTDGTISSRSANALGECNGFIVINGKYVPYWNNITP